MDQHEAPHIEVTVDEGLAILRLTRPQRMNALSLQIVRTLESEVPRLIENPQVRAIMITGTGRAFCAGGDVNAMAGPSDADETLAGMKRYHPWLTALRYGDKPVIAAVNGVAAGAGFGLALIADVIVAADTAAFKCAFGSLGAAPDYGLGFTLPRIVGPVHAADLLFGDRRISAQEARDMGIVSRLFPSATFDAEALALARELAALPRASQLTKRLLRFGEREQFAAYLDAEAQSQVEAFQSADFAEGVSAFMARRKPCFQGR